MARAYLRPGSLPFTLLLGMMPAVQAIGTAITLPALPVIADAFHTDAGMAQLTVSAFLAGLSASLVLTGALADRFGRKPVLLAGLILFTLAGFACALAPSIEWLIAFRVLQGAGGASGIVAGRAMVRDLFERERAIQMIAYIGGVISIMPMFAPALSSALLSIWSWRVVFVALSGISLAIALAFTLLMAESLKAPDRNATNVPRILANCWRFLTTRACMAYAGVMFMGYGAFFSYMAILPYVLVKAFGVPVGYAGLFVALVGISTIIGTLAGSRLAVRWPVRRTLAFSTSGAFVVGLVVLGTSYSGLTGTVGILAIVGPMVLYGIAFGITHPTCIASSMQPVPDIAGVASAMSGTLQMASGAFFTWLAGYLFDGTPSTIGICVAITATSAFLIFLFFVRPLEPKAVRT